MACLGQGAGTWYDGLSRPNRNTTTIAARVLTIDHVVREGTRL
jgi:hypothetical protein